MVARGRAIQHGHLGREMSQVTLHHVDRRAGVQQGGGFGVPQPVAAGNSSSCPYRITQPEGEAELPEHPVAVLDFPGPGGMPVSGGLGKQVAGRDPGPRYCMCEPDQ